MTTTETIRFPAHDGYVLTGDLRRARNPVGSVVFASATGVPRRLYNELSAHFAANGLNTLTFDYRGIGDSAPDSLRGFEARLEQWATHDLAAAIDYLENVDRSLPLLYFGHSIGGQLLGIVPNKQKLAAALLVASQSGYWKLWSGVGRMKMFFYWYVLFPAMLRLFGYLPMGRVVGGEDLPRGVAEEWMDWGRRPEYMMSNELARRADGFGSFTQPMRMYAFTDDPYAPPAAVKTLVTFYYAAARELRVIHPNELGLEKIGHFSFTKPHMRDTLWDELVGWMLERISAPRTSSASPTTSAIAR